MTAQQRADEMLAADQSRRRQLRAHNRPAAGYYAMKVAVLTMKYEAARS